MQQQSSNTTTTIFEEEQQQQQQQENVVSQLPPPPLIHKGRKIHLSPRTLLYVCRGLLCTVIFLCASTVFFVGSSLVWLAQKSKFISENRAALYMARCAAVTMAVAFSFVLEKLCGLQLEFSGDVASVPFGEDAIIVANHVTNVDFMLIVAYQNRLGMGGHGKYMSKEAIKHVPLFGWALNMMGQVFLKRNWEMDKSKVTAAFDFLLQSKIPAQIGLLPEGTRINEKKRAESLEFARQRNIQPLLYQVLVPRPKGFAAIVEHMRGSHFKYVYDITIGYVDGTVRVRDLFLSPLHGDKVLFNVKRIALRDLPEDATSVQTWLHDRFHRKDQLLSSMRTNRRFEGEPIAPLPFAIRMR